MRNRTQTMGSAALAFAALMTSAVATAQDNRWYRVELLVFANESTAAQGGPGGNPGGAESPEQWDPTPTLSYPEPARFLVDPARIARYKAEFDGEGTLDKYGRLIIDVTGTDGDLPPGSGAGMAADGSAAAESAATQSPQAQPPAIVRPTPVIDPAPRRPTPVISGEPVATGAGAAPAVAQNPASPPALPRPFVLLPREQQEFGVRAAHMKRTGSYSILFHESWVQPIIPEENSLAIVLDHSGDDEQWPRLQGSVKIFVSRYLHLETDLWLNTMGQYFPGTWKMPAPPLGPPSLIVKEEEPVDIAAALPGMQAYAEGNTETAGNPAAPAAPAGTPPAAVAPADPNNPGSSGVASGGAVPGSAVEPEVQGPVYPFRHAVALRQNRRMRSAEIHYIDHPLLGVIVKFTPVTAEELATIAAAQVTALGEDPDQAP